MRVVDMVAVDTVVDTEVIGALMELAWALLAELLLAVSLLALTTIRLLSITHQTTMRRITTLLFLHIIRRSLQFSISSNISHNKMRQGLCYIVMQPVCIIIQEHLVLVRGEKFFNEFLTKSEY
jgi:hypothetical protein